MSAVRRGLPATMILLALLANVTLPLPPALAQRSHSQAGSAQHQPPARSAPGEDALLATLGLPTLSFEANRGQFDAPVRFAARHAGGIFFFTTDKLVVVLGRDRYDGDLEDGEGLPSQGRQLGAGRGGQVKARSSEQLALEVRLVDASPEARIEGLDRLPGELNYFRGNDPARWQRGVPTYGSILYQGLYPDIDLKYYGIAGRLKYDFVLQPGADVARIALAYDGADGLRVTQTGQLEIGTAWGVLLEEAPLAWQEGEKGEREAVNVCYRLGAQGRVSFQVGAYDPARPLVIDPGLVYSTFVGGSAWDNASAHVLDAAGNVVVTGGTSSPNFPSSAGSYDTSYNGGADETFGPAIDVFVLKLARG